MVVLVAGTKDLACAVVVAGYYIRACRPQCVCARASDNCPCAALHVVVQFVYCRFAAFAVTRMHHGSACRPERP